MTARPIVVLVALVVVFWFCACNVSKPFHETFLVAAAMPWFRLYSSILDEPKVQLLPDPLFKAWINILAVANRSETRGVIRTDSVNTLFWLRLVDRRELETLLNQLKASGLMEQLSETEWTPHRWTERQSPNDSSTLRVQKYRENERRKKHDETFHANPGNVSGNGEREEKKLEERSISLIATARKLSSGKKPLTDDEIKGLGSKFGEAAFLDALRDHPEKSFKYLLATLEGREQDKTVRASRRRRPGVKPESASMPAPVLTLEEEAQQRRNDYQGAQSIVKPWIEKHGVPRTDAEMSRFKAETRIPWNVWSELQQEYAPTEGEIH